MRKLIVLLMVLLMLTGCSGKKNDTVLSVDPKPAEKPVETVVQEEEPEEIIEEVQEEPEPEETEEAVTDSTIRPEVKEAIDAYESFIDGYCEFMVQYEESDGTDPKLLLDYMQMIAELESYSTKMDAMEGDLTDAEYWYYVEVINRCNEKLLKASR